MSEEVITKSPGSLLADEMYAEPTPEVTPDAPTETPEEPTQEVQEVQDDVPQETQAEAETSEDVEEVEVTTVEQLADHFELDPEWLQGLSVKQKVNGKEIDVQLGEALSTHRKVTAADTYLAEAKQKSKAMLEQANQHNEQLNHAIVTAGTFLKAIENQIVADEDSADMDRLRRQDPAEYAAKKEELRERKEKLDELRHTAIAEYQQVTEHLEQQRQSERMERLPQEQEIFLGRVPEWTDDTKASQEREELVNYLHTEGFDQNEIDYASYNGRMLAMAVKAMRYDKSKGKSEAIKKKVVKIPKVLKPGKKQGEQSSKPKGDDPVSTLYG